MTLMSKWIIILRRSCELVLYGDILTTNLIMIEMYLHLICIGFTKKTVTFEMVTVIYDQSGC